MNPVEDLFKYLESVEYELNDGIISEKLEAACQFYTRPAPPKVETVEEWENRTGRKYPDNCPVWCKWDIGPTEYPDGVAKEHYSKYWIGRLDFVRHLNPDRVESDIYVTSPDHAKPEE